MSEIAQALYNPIAYQSQLEQLERRTRQLSVFDDDIDEPRRVIAAPAAAAAIVFFAVVTQPANDVFRKLFSVYNNY